MFSGIRSSSVQYLRAYVSIERLSEHEFDRRFLWILLEAANAFVIAVLPRTDGFTKLGPTILCVCAFIMTTWSLAKLIQSGLQLSILMPVAAAVVPLAAIGVGVLTYGESASLSKIGLLIVACVLVRIAARA